MEIINVRMLVIIEVVMTAMIKSLMRIRATISEENMRKIEIIDLMRSYSNYNSEDGSYDGDGTYYASHSNVEDEECVIPRRILIRSCNVSKLNGNANPLTWEELKELMRFKYVPKEYTKVYNGYSRRHVLRIKVDIYGSFVFYLVLDDWCNLNYIAPSTVAYLRLPKKTRCIYIKKGCKVTKVLKVTFTHA
ncbi:hypothetical protein KY290_033577 [Solanum tuberosum]|uniref:Uncharacterized protein n=1 Tax=Solanum tuberosum TaxID=4113 RepID=A0ABQ7U1S6_SOLTU|nr:hypothetical protein KY289_032949 [Solanum tuberosum]KAH0647586.1 hypothetical protein KY285_032834 [Solanum tuberosum]KAH0740534.1 hypothetical protein KY290_033577 [Solanum tuberosum]